MTGIEIDGPVAPQQTLGARSMTTQVARQIGQTGLQVLLPEGDHIFGAFEGGIGFRLFDARQVSDHLQVTVRHLFMSRRAVACGSVATSECRDAQVSGIGGHPYQYICDATGRIGAGDMGPRGQVDLLLDAFRMKILEWKSVDGVEVQIEVTQMISERLRDSFSRELPGEALADVGSDGKGFAGTDPVSNRNHEVIDGGSEITHRRSGVSVHLVTEGVTSCALGDEHGGYGAPVLDMTLPETPSMVLLLRGVPYIVRLPSTLWTVIPSRPSMTVRSPEI